MITNFKDTGVELATYSLKARIQQLHQGNIFAVPPEQYYTPESSEDKTLVFESWFESGNLNLAIKSSNEEYNLILQNDINTNGHTQWFFFWVGNTTKGKSVKFNILNLAKPDSLYNYGMKVLCFSEKANEEQNWEWFWGGSEISYYKNNFKKESHGYSKNYYTFTFTYQF